MNQDKLSLQRPPRIDVHIHLAASGCQADGCWLSPSLRRRYTIKLLQLFHRLSAHDLDTRLDTLWPERITKLVAESSLDYGVVLGFDGATDASGELDWQRSQMVITAQWVFAVCKRFPNLLPGPSLNPHRKDALDLLAYCITEKAVLIKWLPSAQLINPAASGLKPFYRQLAAHGLPLLVHCGGERTFKSYDPSLNHLSLLRPALDEGVKVIIAHSATPVLASGEESQIPLLRHYLANHPNLWVDNSGLCNPSRFAHLPQLAADPLIASRTLYGSDWPVPPHAFYYMRQLGWKATRALDKEANWLERDIKLKRAFAYPESTLTAAAKVLANLDHWVQPLAHENLP